MWAAYSFQYPGRSGSVSRRISNTAFRSAADRWANGADVSFPVGADPARMALSLCHVLGEVAPAEAATGAEDDVVTVR